MAENQIPTRAPRADDATRRDLRRELFQARQDVQRKKEVLCDISTNQLDEAIRRSDALLTKAEGVQRPKELAQSAEEFRNLTECNNEQANKLVQRPGRTPRDLLAAMKAKFVHTANPQVDGAEDPYAFCWGEVGATAEHQRRPARGASCMFGPMLAQAKERKAIAQRQKRQAPAELVRPEEKDCMVEGGEEKQDTDRNMEVMLTTIRAQNSSLVGFPELVLNASSFAQTVENIFTLSFLVRDNRVALVEDEERGWCVRPLEGRGKAAQQQQQQQAAQQGQGQQAAPPRLQFIMSFHLKDWEEMKRYVRPSDCLMPHRDKAAQQERDKAAAAAQERESKKARNHAAGRDM
ncbi:hypothetical protein HYH02_006681 [Chlamydomonas schloesseri]|uniref:Non-structural maintenance of chromosomes element 4 n=1 Tax=Chlamydomonas schloesseri TaxID=2026947 RepID=A0A835SST3_9CHLO|nr:hypothetical protein HYH02_006681 [Chlamydomonas schloesseri]|eukprot:KAG2432697.1 hypothetical protein HYH02_006681 [Chlamydomonas schloesseri]